jgi:hypothetical protein
MVVASTTSSNTKGAPEIDHELPVLDLSSLPLPPTKSSRLYLPSQSTVLPIPAASSPPTATISSRSHVNTVLNTVNSNLNNNHSLTKTLLSENLTIPTSAPHITAVSPTSRPTTTHGHTYKVQKSTLLRRTCESCRKLKICCVPSLNGGDCQKCVKKGTACVHLPRAAYKTRVKKV